MKKTFLYVLLTLTLALGLTVPAVAQTSLNSTTLAEALTADTDTVSLTSATNVANGNVLFVDREAMIITALSGTTATVRRGRLGSAAASHVALALVYSGAPERFAQSIQVGSCTRGSIQFLPRIVMPQGDVWDCPVGAGVWSLANAPATLVARSVWFNLDNGAGTTVDDVLIRPLRPIRVTACRAVYVDATTGTVAAGNFRIGTAVAGEEIVASTAYENSKAVGVATAGVIVSGAVAANVPVIVRHTGVAATAAGQAVVECEFHYL